MSHGGRRLGAGRPKGSKNRRQLYSRGPSEPVATPLKYMLAVMNDSKADPLRRDKMAIAAAPYLHKRASESGKKDAAADAAKDAGLGSDWGDDLLPRGFMN
jgi:hypothetical protein